MLQFRFFLVRPDKRNKKTSRRFAVYPRFERRALLGIHAVKSKFFPRLHLLDIGNAKRLYTLFFQLLLGKAVHKEVCILRIVDVPEMIAMR